MNKMKKQRKGFTLTELAIVIAVIAILIAVLVPTFVSLINKANESNDSVTVKNLNTILSIDEAENGKCNTMSQALSVVEEEGYSVTKLSPLSSGDIVWDQESNRFLLVNGEEVVYSDTSVTDITSSNLSSKSYQLWYIAQNADDVAKGTYSYYIAYETTSVTAKYGVDVGENTNVNVIISSTAGSQIDAGSKYAAASKKLTAGNTTTSIIVNTNGGTLEVDYSSLNVIHYGTSTTVTLTSVTSYTTTATISTINVDAASATVTVESTATVTSIVATVSATIDYDSSTTTVYASSGATISTSSGTTVTTSSLSTVTTADDFISKVTAGGAVVLGANIDVTSTINVTKDTIIYLNGYILNNKVTGSTSNTVGTVKNSESCTYSDYMFYIKNGCTSFTIDGTIENSTVTIDDSISSFGLINVKCATEITLNGGTYTGNTIYSRNLKVNGTQIALRSAFLYIGEFDDSETGNTVVLLNDVTADTNRIFTYVNGIPSITMDVVGGTYKSSDDPSATDYYAVSVIETKDVNSKLTFTDVTVSSLGAGIEVECCTADFTNCNFTNTGSYGDSYSYTALSVSGNGIINVYSGTYTGFIYCAYVYSSGGTINIYDGEFSATTVLRADKDQTNYSDAVSTINVYDGLFTGDIYITYDTTINVEGGTYVSGTITNNGTFNDKAGWDTTTTTD